MSPQLWSWKSSTLMSKLPLSFTWSRSWSSKEKSNSCFLFTVTNCSNQCIRTCTGPKYGSFVLGLGSQHSVDVQCQHLSIYTCLEMPHAEATNPAGYCTSDIQDFMISCHDSTWVRGLPGKDPITARFLAMSEESSCLLTCRGSHGSWCIFTDETSLRWLPKVQPVASYQYWTRNFSLVFLWERSRRRKWYLGRKEVGASKQQCWE